MKDIKLLSEGFHEYQKGCGYSQSTIKRSMTFLRRFAKWLNGKDIRNVSWENIADYKEYLMQVKHSQTGNLLKPSTIELELQCVKSFFEYLLNYEMILVNPLEGMKLKVEGAVKTMRPIFTEEDITLFLDSINTDTTAGQRDRAIFELIYSSGLRAREALNLKCEDLNLEERVLVVKGKGNKDRYVPFSETARKFLLKYISAGRKKLERIIRKKDNRRYLFLGHKGAILHVTLSRNFKKYLNSCELSDKGYTIHSIRHSTATHLLTEGAGIRYVQELLGHEDLKTTQIYTRPTEQNIRGIYRTYHPRENEYFREVDKTYLKELQDLKDRLIWGRKANEQKKRNGHSRGIGNWKRRIEDSQRSQDI